jgi:hydrogenase maturation factor
LTTRLPLGKIPIDILGQTVLRLTGSHSQRIATPPKAGLDFAAIELDDGYMVVSADPVTGVREEIGRYAVNVSANDVATSGNRPQFIESVVLLPEESRSEDLRRIAEEMNATAKALGIAIVGGHTEVTPGLSRPIVVVTAFSYVADYVSSEDALVGDTLMMTKSAGLEGTAVIAREGGLKGRRVPSRLAKRAGRLVARLSIVEEAAKAYATGCVHAMHDCTEGGVVGACYEMSLASELGFVLRESSIPVKKETREICSMFSLDPLKLIGSGSVLMAVKRGMEGDVKRALKGVCEVEAVGEFTGGKRILVKSNGRESVVRNAPTDELWRALGTTH